MTHCSGHEPTAVSQWVRRFADLVPAGGSVLDLAAGSGRHTRFLLGLGYHVTAVDRDVSALADLQNRTRLTILTADLEDGGPWPLGDRQATGRVDGDKRALARGVDRAFDGTYFGEGSQTTGIVVVQRGRIVAEKYRKGFGPQVSQRTWSVAKSLAGTLVGVAQQQGVLDPAQPAAIGQWQQPGDPRGAITTDNLLRMASGLHSSTAGNRTDALYFGGAAVDQEAGTLPLLKQPGSTFRYANNDTVLALRGLRERLGDEQQALAFPFTQLLWKIGMTRTVPETDWRGNYVMSSQVWTTARDLARLGLLYQNDGVFQGQRLLPEGWVRYVSSASGPQPPSGFGYGATFWLFNDVPGVPGIKAYLTFGRGGTLTETNSNPGFDPGLRGPGHGYWDRTGKTSYQFAFEAFIQFDSA